MFKSLLRYRLSSDSSAVYKELIAHIENKETQKAVNLIDQLAKQDVSLNVKYDGITALMKAACKGNTEVISKLVEAKASLDVQSKYRSLTALMVASLNDQTKAVAQLIAAKASLNINDQFGKTAFDIAKAEKNINIAKKLNAAMKKQVVQKIIEAINMHDSRLSFRDLSNIIVDYLLPSFEINQQVKSSKKAPRI